MVDGGWWWMAVVVVKLVVKLVVLALTIVEVVVTMHTEDEVLYFLYDLKFSIIRIGVHQDSCNFEQEFTNARYFWSDAAPTNPNEAVIVSALLSCVRKDGCKIHKEILCELVI